MLGDAKEWLVAHVRCVFSMQVLVTVGKRVNADEPLCVVVAMKMEVVVKAPVSGTFCFRVALYWCGRACLLVRWKTDPCHAHVCVCLCEQQA